MSAVLILGITLFLRTTPQRPSRKGPENNAPTYGSGDHFEHLDEDKVSRTYIVRIPPGLDGKRKAPLVMFLHDWTSDAKNAELLTGFGKEADKEGFILVLPDGLGKPQGWNCGFLNLGGQGDDGHTPSDDVKFLTDVLNAVGKKVKVDPKRVFVAGHSVGGMMAFVLGGKLSSRIAAIGVVDGTTGLDRGDRSLRVAAPATPVSAILIHGVRDPTVPYSHGPGLFSDAYSAVDSAQFWAKADSLPGPPTVTTAAKGNIEQRDWRSGRIEVKLISIANGTHDWPGGISWDGQEKTTEFDATAQIWGFFASHPKP